MHASSYHEMRRVLTTYLAESFETPLDLLDVGGASVNRSFPHTYREHMPAAWRYRACDIADGPNVDFVQAGPYHIQDEPRAYDVILCGQVLEHVPYPHRLIREMARLLRGAGYLIVTAPWQWEIHRYPVDCVRVLPDGLRTWMSDAGLDVLSAYTVERDCWGIGRRES